jgi:hypothetical protein
MKNLTKWSYDNKQFRSVSNTNDGEVTQETIFEYRQIGQAISAKYQGGNIREGNLLGTVDTNGIIHMSYQHWNTDNQFRTGICVSKPELLPNGKIRLYESWQWTNGSHGKGESIIEEI